MKIYLKALNSTSMKLLVAKVYSSLFWKPLRTYFMEFSVFWEIFLVLFIQNPILLWVHLRFFLEKNVHHIDQRSLPKHPLPVVYEWNGFKKLKVEAKKWKCKLGGKNGLIWTYVRRNELYWGKWTGTVGL